jgi:thioredoxin 1
MKQFNVSNAIALALATLLVGGCAQVGSNTAQQETNTNIVHLTAGNFQKQVLASTKPVVVDFWAPWCGPCRTLAPTISQLADQYQGRVVVGKVNVDDEGALAQKYGIEGIPAVFIFKDGKPVQTLVGSREKKEYEAILNPLVGAGGTAPTPQ